MNKKLFLVLGLFCIGFGRANAADLTRKLPNWIMTEAFYLSSATCAQGVVMSSIAASGTFIYGVDVTSAGLGGSQIELFNSNNSTNVLNTKINSPIDGSKMGWHPFNFFASSGVAVNNGVNTAGSPACITIYYQDRK